MASQVYWVREINGNQEVDPILQRINEISDNQSEYRGISNVACETVFEEIMRGKIRELLNVAVECCVYGVYVLPRFLYCLDHSNRKVLAMGDVLDSIRSTHDNPNEFLEQSKEQSMLHPLEFCVQIYRKHCSKSPPFCNSIYGLTDQLISLQLVMAQKNKEVC